MNLLVVGDVHGCFYTFKALLDRYWDPAETVLVQVGDLINKGPYSAECVAFAMEMAERHGPQFVALRGNHEQLMIDAHRENRRLKAYRDFKEQVKSMDLKYSRVARWLSARPLSYERQNLLISHAGLAKSCPDPFDIRHPESLINNRQPLQNLRSTQVIGHVVLKQDAPFFSTRENAWYIDTGAYLGRKLTALFFNGQTQSKVIEVQTDVRDC